MFYRSISRIVLIISMFFVAIPSVFAVVITHTVTIQPIVVSDASGSNTATFFGSMAQQDSIESVIDNIWEQAGIDVNFLEANEWNNSFANTGTSNPRPGSDLNTIVTTATTESVIHTNLDFINLFFVNVPAGFGSLGANNAAGLAFVGDNGITQYVGSGLLDFSGGREVIADVVAHEIGHNLGLFHTASGINNLMSPNGMGDLLTVAQIETALNSRFSTPIVSAVPVPAAIWLMASALLGLFSFSRNRGQLYN